MQLRNMKIGIRAAGMFTLLGVLVLALGLIALYETRRMDSATDEIRLTWMPSVLALGEVSSNLGRARALTLRSVLEDSSSARHATLDKIVQINQQLESDLKAYERTINAADDRALFDTFMGLSERYHALQQAIRAAAGNDRLDEARRLV
ncbi:MAG: MCP four helix bundle domain-containing protein, partial [Pseudomonas sp.]|nr:MCP four helix bundle domain-containing protein [Pseudomonas sp.]